MTRVKIRVSTLLTFFLFVSTSFALKASDLPNIAPKRHAIGFGIAHYFFAKDLKEINNDTTGFTFDYNYQLPFEMIVQPAIGVETSYFIAHKDNTMNEYLLLGLKTKFDTQVGDHNIGVFGGLDTQLWVQTQKFIREELLLADWLFGSSVGAHAQFKVEDGRYLDFIFTYHFQEFHNVTSFYSTGLQYTWVF